MAMKAQNKAYVFAALAVLCWSTVASAFKLTLREVDYLTLLLVSSAVSTAFLFLVLVVRKRVHLISDSFAATGRPLLRSAANGFLNPFLYYVVLFKAYSLLPAQEAQPLNYTRPLMLVLLSAPMLGQRIRPVSVAAMLVSFLGVLIISTHGDLLGLRFTNLPGALLAMGSAVVWALFWLVNVRDGRDEGLKLFLNFLFGFAYVAAAAVVLTVLGLRPAVVPHLTPAGAIGCAYTGLMEMGVAFTLWLKALRLTEATAKVSNLVFLSPFVSLIFIRVAVGERILPSSILGLVFIAGGILLQRHISRA